MTTDRSKYLIVLDPRLIGFDAAVEAFKESQYENIRLTAEDLVRDCLASTWPTFISCRIPDAEFTGIVCEKERDDSSLCHGDEWLMVRGEIIPFLTLCMRTTPQPLSAMRISDRAPLATRYENAAFYLMNLGAIHLLEAARMCSMTPKKFAQNLANAYARFAEQVAE